MEVGMKQKIAGYLKDMENHWVAKLECGHVQHVRHNPPWQTREWATTEAGRESHLGSELNCVVCDETRRLLAKEFLSEIKKRFLEAYEDAGISGLCHEGRLEAAWAAVETLPEFKS